MTTNMLPHLCRRVVACRARKLLEPCDFATIDEVPEAENISPSYDSRVLRMTLLPTEIVEAILTGHQPQRLAMAKAMQPFPYEWKTQLLHFG